MLETLLAPFYKMVKLIMD